MRSPLFFIATLAFFAPFFEAKKPDGAALARQHCQTCHALPAPDLLDKTTWAEYVLPRMGAMLAVEPLESAGDFLEAETRAEALQNPLVFLQNPAMSPRDWVVLKAYFLENAPDRLPESAFFSTEKKPKKPLEGFAAEFPEYHFSPPGATFLSLEKGRITLGDAQQKGIFEFDERLVLQKKAASLEGLVSIHRLPSGDAATFLGSFSPTDKRVGQVLFYPKNGAAPSVLIDSLRRPAHSAMGDLDGDGLEDLVVCEFGKWLGRLAWHRNLGNGRFERRELLPLPGAIRSQIADLDGDGFEDIVALFGQGDEGVWAFFNQKNTGVFEPKRLLRFPPSWGSAFFELLDWDADGDLDVLHASGDGADFPPIEKQYQGIRIFENDGKNAFSEAFFWPFPGAYGAAARDFDQDGDLDVAAISFFPSFEKGERDGFLYLKNEGGGRFEAQFLPSASAGRWLVLSAGDVDGDGDDDLALGSLAFEVPKRPDLPRKWAAEGLPFLLLRNTRR